MKLHEFQSKEIFRKHGLQTPRGILVSSPEEAASAAESLGTTRVAVKAQVLAGGRGKGGGVRVVSGASETREAAEQILSHRLITAQTGAEGVAVRHLLIEEGMDLAKEFYVSITLDRAREQHLFMCSSEGGMDIEEVAASTPEKIVKEWADPAIGLQPFQARRLAVALGLGGEHLGKTAKFLMQLWNVYKTTDANLVEVNPMVLTGDGNIVALDAKLDVDDSSLFRHPDLAELRDTSEDAALEVEARKNGLNYIKLDGNVGCMVNGAGLAMATMDIIQLAGGMPANFLDVGGGASTEQVAAAFRILMGDPKVQSVYINIFGGILRCDVLARGVVDAAKQVGARVPIVVRLEGTNVAEGRRILNESDIDFKVADSMADGAEQAVAAVGGAQ